MSRFEGLKDNEWAVEEIPEDGSSFGKTHEILGRVFDTGNFTVLG